VDLLFFAANLIKLVSGAWLPLHGPAERPRLLPLIRQADIEALAMMTKLSYFLSRIELARGNAPGMSSWRKRLFVATSWITADAAELWMSSVTVETEMGALCWSERIGQAVRRIGPT